MLVFAALIAGAFSIGSQAAPFIDPAALTAMRFAGAGCVMGAVVLATGTPLRREHLRAPWRYLLLGGLMGLYFVLMFEALRTAEPISTSAMFTLIPAMSALFGWLLMRQVYPPLAQIALVIGAIGSIWVIFRADMDALLALRLGRGESVFFFGCVAHALYTPLVPRLNRGEPVLVFSLGAIVGAFIVVGLYAAPALMATEWGTLPGIVWVTVAYLAIFTTTSSFALLQFAALRLPSGKVMAYGYLTPAFVALYEGMLGHGWPDAVVWAGVGVIICALVILLFGADA